MFIATKTTCSVHRSAYIVSNLSNQPWPGWVRYGTIFKDTMNQYVHCSVFKLETGTVFVILSDPPYKEEVSGSKQLLLNLYLNDIVEDIFVF